jgi:two-component system CheB/CheR fusion protein
MSKSSLNESSVAEAPAEFTNHFPIVGIGASAGGLEALESFFRACPLDTGMAFVLVPHLDPDHHSQLAAILQRSSQMEVSEALDLLKVAPNHIYIIPPNRDMAILNGVLQLSIPSRARGQRLPIDYFFRSLAEDQAEQAIGIILSGMASDGTSGLHAILVAGGVCMVQEPATAKFDSMPKNAINAGYVTHILTVEEMPAKLIELFRQSPFRQKLPRVLPSHQLSALNQILLQIRNATGHDFSLYKKSTIGRRIERRMALHRIDDIDLYARFIKRNPAEVNLLFKELLINVTSFFRDPEAFVVLKADILPLLLTHKPEGYVFRVWVAGCASGEEAYSIAMVLCEYREESHQNFNIQIYATDLDDESIASARAGLYSNSITQDVSAARLSRFFTADSGGYKIKKEVRDIVVFAVQSVIKDAPFTKLDLLSCRNLMIYLEAEQQNRLIPNFHYALNPGGVLFLSNCESIPNHSELFHSLNRKWKFYLAIATPNRPFINLSGSSSMSTFDYSSPAKLAETKTSISKVAELSSRILLQSYAPASVTTDIKGNILYVHGDTSRFLRQPAGVITTNVIDMVHQNLQQPLRAALLGAVRGELVLNREELLSIETGLLKISFSVRLLPSQTSQNEKDRLLLVSFQKVEAQAPLRRVKRKGSPSLEEMSRAEHLERELGYAKENLQATIEEQQATNEELKSANEELQSTNEELQSSNEELETSREEMQSMNEEVIAMNSELNSKVELLDSVKNDLKNLLDNVNSGTIFLDYDLKIRRYTRDAVKAYCLIPSDVGRPLSDIRSNLEGENLFSELQAVLDDLTHRERDVRALDGKWYLARMQPYRTVDNVIVGVVLTFTDITASHEAAQLKLGVAQLARELAEGIVDTVAEPLLVLDGQLQVVSASHAFYEYFKVEATDTIGYKIYELGNGQWNIPALRELIENILPQKKVMKGFVVEHDFPGVGYQRMVLNARRFVTALGNTEFILLAMLDEKVSDGA